MRMVVSVEMNGYLENPSVDSDARFMIIKSTLYFVCCSFDVIFSVIIVSLQKINNVMWITILFTLLNDVACSRTFLLLCIYHIVDLSTLLHIFTVAEKIRNLIEVWFYQHALKDRQLSVYSILVNYKINVLLSLYSNDVSNFRLLAGMRLKVEC